MSRREPDYTTVRLKKEVRKKLLIAISRHTVVTEKKVSTSEFIEFLCDKYAESFPPRWTELYEKTKIK